MEELLRQSSRIKRLAKDIRVNKIGYIKSRIVMEEIKAHDNNISFVWKPEDKVYIASYKEG